MKLVNLADGVGVLDGDSQVGELDAPYRSVAELLAEHPIDAVPGFGVRRTSPLAEAPLRSLGCGVIVWGIGLNYRSKLAATGRPVPEHPTLFVKSPSAFDGGGDVPPPASSAQVDFEGEIAVVVGTHLFEARPHDAAAGIAGVAAANDLTARDVMRSTGNPSLAKSFPGFGQVGAVVATRGELTGLDAIGLATRVNGRLRQEDSSAGMLLSIPELLSILSRYVVLRPGDIVLSGTPAGTGEDDAEYLQPGDVVEVVVDSLPPLVTRVGERSAVANDGIASRIEGSDSLVGTRSDG